MKNLDSLIGSNYEIILADPPWQYTDKANAGKRGAEHKYSVMTLPQIKALPVAQIAAKDCVLFMWHTGPLPRFALQVLAAWGFELKNMKAFTWIKLNKKFGDSMRKDMLAGVIDKGISDADLIAMMNRAGKIGMGNWTRANTEDCLVAVKGNPKRVNAGIRQLVFSPIREHSEKPAEVRDRIVELMGDRKRIELFARHKVKGWDGWGNEYGVLGSENTQPS